MTTSKSKFKWLLILCGIVLAFCLIPMGAAFAADTTTPIRADGKTIVQDGNVTVTVTSDEDKNAVIAKNKSDVTVNGSVTTTGEDGQGVYATEQSTVTTKDVINKGDFSGAVSAEDGSTVSTDNINVSGVTTHGAQANNAKINAKDILAEGNNTVAASVTDGGVIKAHNITTEGEESVGVETYGNASADISGSVKTNGLNANGVVMAQNPSGTVRVGGDVSARQGYGAVIQVTSTKRVKGVKASSLVVEGTLLGQKAPIAIMPYYYDTLDWMGRTTHHYMYDFSDYNMDDLPTIIVKALVQGDQMISIVEYDADGNLVEIIGEKAEAWRNAILKNIQYITPTGDTQTVTIDGKTYTYTVTKQQAGLTRDDQATLPPTNNTTTKTDKTAVGLPPATNDKSVKTAAKTGTPTAYTASATNTDTTVSPQTGDTTDVAALMVLLVTACAGAVGVMIYRRRHV